MGFILHGDYVKINYILVFNSGSIPNVSIFLNHYESKGEKLLGETQISLDPIPTEITIPSIYKAMKNINCYNLPEF